MQLASTFQVYNASAGSGKTFTLVKEYLKILLESSDAFRFQTILAITFTNKAAAEMKDRVIKNLKLFSEGEKNDLYDQIQQDLQLDSDVLSLRSKNVLDAILQNYTAFSITTIDSFTHKIIKSFAFDLGLNQNFEVELDAAELLEQAIDALISKIGSNKEVTNVLVQYSLDKIEDDKSWDVTRDLLEFAKILLREEDAQKFKKIADKNLSDFELLQKKLRKENQTVAQKFYEIGKKGLELIESLGLEHADFSYRDLPNLFDKLLNYEVSTQKNTLNFYGRLNENIEEEKDLYPKKSSEKAKQSIETHKQDFYDLYYESKMLFEQYDGIYKLNSLFLKSIIPLAVLTYINEELTQIKNNNNVRLISEFNELISEGIQEQPAPFIYERIGQKYRHFFIDEMQDTSLLQWQNLVPLLHNTLSQKDTSLMLVGDAKQSIYRWRGGKAEQFIGLGTENDTENPFTIPKTVKTLETNYRSLSEIVTFNNEFFLHASEFLNNSSYRELFKNKSHQNTNSKTGGFVSIDFLSKEEDKEIENEKFAKKTLELIEDLSTQFSLGEICILVRKKNEGEIIANYLSENDIPIVSSETLLLKNSKKVLFLISLLEYVEHKSDDAKFSLLYFLHDHLKLDENVSSFFLSFSKSAAEGFWSELQKFSIDFNLQKFLTLSLYEKMEYAIRQFRLLEKSDAYVQFFLDELLRFQQKEMGIQDALDYWGKKKDSLSIVSPDRSDAVQIMTIHKSKGLEFPVVIFPGDLDVYQQIQPKIWIDKKIENFDDFLIPYQKTLSGGGAHAKKLYDTKQHELELDAINLLYVALTRAKEQLFVVTNKQDKKIKEIRYSSQFFVSFLKQKESYEEDKLHYSFGTSERKQKEKLQEQSFGETQNEFISVSRESHQIELLASASKLWGTIQEEAIQYGNYIHQLMSKILYKEDVEKVIQSQIEKGLLSNSATEKVRKILQSIVTHKKLQEYFMKGQKIFNERSLIDKDGQVFVPDRLVFKQEQVAIIDYKTGAFNESHKQQLLKYERVLNSMGFVHCSKILVYIDETISVVKF